jgi:hypothetical protein
MVWVPGVSADVLSKATSPFKLTIPRLVPLSKKLTNPYEPTTTVAVNVTVVPDGEGFALEIKEMVDGSWTNSQDARAIPTGLETVTVYVVGERGVKTALVDPESSSVMAPLRAWMEIEVGAPPPRDQRRVMGWPYWKSAMVGTVVVPVIEGGRGLDGAAAPLPPHPT